MKATVVKSKRLAQVFTKECVGCGSCIPVCKRGAITVPEGVYAVVDVEKCIGCGLCATICPASVIKIVERKNNTEVIAQ